MSANFTNQLINETSPYLLQHAHNPVNWFAWGEEALQKAKAEDKVILVSIGYSACHWCHVMEKESFENEGVATIMNEHFINIKIDREERPDLDHIYMDAVQAISGSGGWPLNVFLTPDAKPFYGGTYFPPVKAFNRSSWSEVLIAINKSWQEKRNEIEAQAENLTAHLQQSNLFGQLKQTEEGVFTKENCNAIFENILKTADKVWGGFGKAPKFPQTFTIQYLLGYYHFTKTEAALQQALLSIDKMIQGGIYDQAGGGLARYSTDNEWLAPHFEKMLYDNALFISVLCDAYQLTKNELYQNTILQTIGFIERELMHLDGGFYAALDADSEGEEGKCYVWQKDEVCNILNEDAEMFCSYFDVSENGNWEGKNILRIIKSKQDFISDNNIGAVEFDHKINACLAKLLAERTKRIRPQTDDKILLGWNALMITALCKAAAALGWDHCRQLAESNLRFIISKFRIGGEEKGFYHTYKKDVAKYPAFLDDYAYLIQACINLQEISSDQNYLLTAKHLTEYVIEYFTDPESGYFFFTEKKQTDVIIRKKEVYDGATPSGNSIMAENLFYLSVIFNRKDWFETAAKMTSSISAAIVKYPASFAVWASGILKQVYGINEVVIVGSNNAVVRNELLGEYLPNKVLQSSGAGEEDFPLLKEKNTKDETLIFLCKNYTCKLPVKTVKALLEVVNSSLGN